MRSKTSVSVGAIVALLSGAAACSSSHHSLDASMTDGGRLDGDAASLRDGDTGPDATTCSGSCPGRRELDLLLVLQDRTAFNDINDPMLPLATELVALSADFDLRVGVITPNLGSGGMDVPDCTIDGDKAILHSGADGSRFVSVTAGLDASALAEDLRGRFHTRACLFQQPLESALLALTPTDSSLTSVAGTPQENTGNVGFLRDGALLTVVIVTEENDCSTSDLGLYRRDSLVYASAGLTIRCFGFPEVLWPVDRYVSGLLSIKSARDLAFFVYAGVPADLQRASYEQILDDDRMQEQIDLMAVGPRLKPSCGNGHDYFPPRREIETAMGLDARGVATAQGSACEPDRARALAHLSDLVHRAAARCCP